MTKQTVETKQISVQRALASLKTIDSQLESFDVKRLTTYLRSGQMERGTKDKKSFASEAQSNLDKLKSLIERRSRIKAAIVQSNAETIVEVAGKKMSVAQAIEMKSSLTTLDDVLRQVRRDISATESTVEFRRQETSRRLESRIDELTKQESKGSETDLGNEIKALRDIHEKTNVFEVYDPAGAREFYEEQQAYIQEFQEEVDMALLESNVRTLIEV